MTGYRDRVLHPIRQAGPRTRRALLVVALILVSLTGTGLALRLDGGIRQDVGPFTATFAVQPSLFGGTKVEFPPLGSLRLATHGGPAGLSLRLDSLDQQRATRLLTEPGAVRRASESAVPDVETGVIRLFLQSAGAAILGAMLLGAIVFRRVTRVAICGGIALVTVLGAGVLALTTFDPSAIEEPRYEGLLANAPAVIGDAHSIANRFDAYRAELQGLVTNVSRLYAAVNTLPVYQPDPTTIRVLHVSDLHLNPAAWSVIATTVSQFQINFVVDTGDIDDWGTTVESSFVAPIGRLGVPYVYIRGNHDSEITARAVAGQSNAIVLENQTTTVDGLTIAGIGDPRFTPDKAMDVEASGPQMDPVYASGAQLAATIRRHPIPPVDFAMVHDPASAPALDGTVPLVLAGHLHHRETEYLPPLQGQPPTLLMVEGSTGGAGLRGLQGDQPTPLEMSVLYFGADKKLAAYDQITVGGTGQSQVTLDRHIVRPGEAPTPEPSTSP
ncbi:MAG TPA: metallophosphoesterase [Micromonosporaceae bacterium]|nr:metallophosphoesterase [Micromonosporaceae bacterium]